MSRLVVGLCLGLGLLGCNPIDAAADCHSICAKYQRCFDKSYNVGACEANCRSRSFNDPDYRYQANKCDGCIDDRTCTSAIFSCGVQCSTVVP